MSSGFKKMLHGEADLEPINLVALVMFNKRPEAMVLNRLPRFRYVKTKTGIEAQDGSFVDVLQGPSGSKAFAGRTIKFHMKDGTTLESKGEYWQTHKEGMMGATYSTVDALQKCYAFTGGACIDRTDFERFRDEYDGPVYEYYDYEKIIKYESERMNLCRRVWAHERTERRMVERIKLLDWKAKQLERILSGSEIEYHP